MYIPLFPLNILPLPGELVPLHIFEPRYRQLLDDAESSDLTFGILLQHPANVERVGALVRLERVIRRHRSGESDIITKAVGVFRLVRIDSCYPEKFYPGGEVVRMESEDDLKADAALGIRFARFQQKARTYPRSGELTLYDMANALNLDIADRMRFIRMLPEEKSRFLNQRIRFELELIRAAFRSKDVFHLN